MAGQLDELKAAVAEQTSVVQSAVVLMHGFADRLAAAAATQDPAELNALVADIRTSTQALADAVAENTVAAPTPDAQPTA